MLGGATLIAVMSAAACFSGDVNAQAVSSGDTVGLANRPIGQQPSAEDSANYELLLGSLLASGANRQFLADLEVRMGRGDSRDVSAFLMEALEAGTIAALIMDRVDSPDLLAFLRTLEKPQPREAASA
jgi:hypothetical protein